MNRDISVTKVGGLLLVGCKTLRV